MKRRALDGSRSFFVAIATKICMRVVKFFGVLPVALHTATFFGGDGLLLNTANVHARLVSQQCHQMTFVPPATYEC